MDDQEEDNITPFWLQNTSPRRRLRRRDSFSLFFNSGFILIFLLAIAFLLIFVIIPSSLSFTARIVKPHLVKRSWDSLNLVLVLFAIVCGFLSRTNNGNTAGSSRSHYNNFAASSSSYHGDRNMYSETINEASKSNPSTPQSHDHWYDFPDRTGYNKLNRLRSGRSYPDLRQESSWVTGDERWRFYDDTFVSNYRFQRSDQRLPESQEVGDNRIGSTKEVEVDNWASIIHQKEVSLPPPPSPPPPERLSPTPQAPHFSEQSSQQSTQSSQALPSKAVRRKPKRRHAEEDNGGEGGSEKDDAEEKNVIYRPLPSPATPPSPPPPPVFSKSGKKRGKDLLISLRRRKKKQRQKSVENLESLFDPQPHKLPSQSPPSPPPPPPPPAFLQGLFSSKKGKAKKVYSVPAAPPPPPPPKTARVSRNVSHSAQPLEARALNTEAQSAQTEVHKLPKPVKTSISNSAADENVDSGNASPLIPIPPPPPPPPFKMPVWRYVVEGDYVRLQSISRSASPELEDSSDKDSSPSAMDGTLSPFHCPSPDVNSKADNFIARFRETLRLEKAKSIKDRGRSNLGPDTTHSS